MKTGIVFEGGAFRTIFSCGVMDAFLEKNIFRNNNQSYNKKCEDIKIIAAQTPKEELNYCISEILRLTRYEGYRYRDIAIVSADMASYGLLAGNICRHNRIPCFVDNK